MLVVGCGGAPKTAPQTPPEQPEEASKLPDPPGSGEVTRTTTENGAELLTYASGDKVYVHKDGTCYAEYSSNCGRTNDDPAAEPMHCNPPPPQQVKCPATK